MKKSFLHLLFFFVCQSAFSQDESFFVNGAVFYNSHDSFIVKKGPSPIGTHGDFISNTVDSFVNTGNIFIEKDFVNDATYTIGKTVNTGNYIVFGDWKNNNDWVADASKVFLRGNNQLITGSTTTTYHDLICENASTTKTQTLDANVKGTLTLNNNELATQNFKMTILNTNTGAIVVNGVNDAFVSSTGIGKLVRKTNSANEYLFPLGWNNGGLILKREIAFTPNDANSHSYEARFAFNTFSSTTTTDDGYNINTKAPSVQNVNDKFYHLLASADNTPATLSIFYDPTADGAWSSIGRWEGSPQWEDLLNTNAVSASPRARMQRNGWIDNTNQPHALIKPTEGDDFAFPNVFAPGSTDPSVPAENKYFTIINHLKKVVLDELLVFNRWGELVFSSKRDGTDKWDGYYQGKLQQQGNYTFIAKVNKLSGQALPPISGNLALIW